MTVQVVTVQRTPHFIASIILFLTSLWVKWSTKRPSDLRQTLQIELCNLSILYCNRCNYLLDVYYDLHGRRWIALAEWPKLPAANGDETVAHVYVIKRASTPEDAQFALLQEIRMLRSQQKGLRLVKGAA